jgi:hypothetical protein
MANSFRTPRKKRATYKHEGDALSCARSTRTRLQGSLPSILRYKPEFTIFTRPTGTCHHHPQLQPCSSDVQHLRTKVHAKSCTLLFCFTAANRASTTVVALGAHPVYICSLHWGTNPNERNDRSGATEVGMFGKRKGRLHSSFVKSTFLLPQTIPHPCAGSLSRIQN